jgi:aryl sulfotransferase
MSEYPKKTREIESHHFNSHKWDSFQFRDSDIIITTSYKSGTTWMQHILLTLEFQGRAIPDNAAEFAPWLDMRVPPLEVQLPGLEAYPLDGRRQIKTHMRLDGFPFSPKAKYIYVGRDGRDQFMSLYNHYRGGNDVWYQLLNESPGLVGDKLPIFSECGYTECSLFDDWISKGWPSMLDETDGYPFWSCFDHARTWWEYRHLPNVKFIHFQDMLDDLAGSIREIAAFVEMPIKEEYFEAIVQSNTFEAMKANADKDPLTAFIGHIFQGGATTFINKGTNGRWKGVLSEAQLKKYDETVKVKWTPECAAWFEKGKASGIDPSRV